MPGTSPCPAKPGRRTHEAQMHRDGDFFPPTLNLLNSREGPAHPLGSSHHIPGLWSPACPGGWRVRPTPAPTTYDMSDDRLPQERQRGLVGGHRTGNRTGAELESQASGSCLSTGRWNVLPARLFCPCWAQSFNPLNCPPSENTGAPLLPPSGGSTPSLCPRWDGGLPSPGWGSLP